MGTKGVIYVMPPSPKAEGEEEGARNLVRARGMEGTKKMKQGLIKTAGPISCINRHYGSIHRRCTGLVLYRSPSTENRSDHSLHP